MRSAHGPALSDIGAHIGHGLTAGHARPRNLGADVGCGLDDGVPPLACLVDVLGLQRYSHAAGGFAGVVDRVVAPPGAVVVPDVVVRVRAMCIHAPSSTQGVGHPLS